MNQFQRTELLLGADNMKQLENARVAVFGVGGVGGYVVEALARTGVGTIDIIDNDDVSLTNINRQIIATLDTVGRSKVDLIAERVASINPECQVNKHRMFYLPETADAFDFKEYDYVVDAIDTVKGKIQLVMAAKEVNVPIISSMGAGNKLNPADFKVADISKTSVCPLAKVMRRELRKRGVNHLKVVYSEEIPIKPIYDDESETKGNAGRMAPGSIAFVPAVVGLIIAGEVIKDLTVNRKEP